MFVVWTIKGLAKRKRSVGNTYSKEVSVNVFDLQKRTLIVIRIIITQEGARALDPRISC